jgi:hypothetical protein
VNAQTRNQSALWGGLLILLGVLSLISMVINFSAWIWFFALTAGGLVMLAVYRAGRSNWWALIPAYVLWAIAGLLALITLGILRDEAIAMYVLAAIALPFLIVFLRDQGQWWALIPTYVLLAIIVLLALTSIRVIKDEFVATYVLWVIAMPFLIVFLSDRRQWWALIPTYVLGVIGLMVALIGIGILVDLLIPAYVMFAIAFPFFVVYVHDPKQWWALIPSGILGILGISFLLATAAIQYIGAVALILAGAWILIRQFARQEPQEPSQPIEVKAPPSGPETEPDVSP